jgi:tetratricopeptide repeat protein 21B
MAVEFKDNVDVRICHGYLLLHNGKAAEAKEAFQAALILASDSIAAFAGLIEAHLQLKQLAEAHDQLEFLDAMVDKKTAPLQIVVIRAKCLRAQKLPTDAKELLEGMVRHLTRFSRKATNMEESEKLRVDQLFDNLIALDMDVFSSAVIEVMNECNTLDHTVQKPCNGAVCDLILIALAIVPGCVPFSYYFAILAYGEERYAQATRAIQFVLGSHWGFNASQCHLLLAQIRLQMKQFDDAEAALSRAVSYEFAIRKTMRYQLINAQLSEARAQYDKAIEIATAIQSTPEYANATPTEKVNLTLFLAECFEKSDKGEQALKTVADAKAQWADTPEADRIEMFRATLIANKGNIRDGIDILEGFTETSPHFARARKAAAKIYLTKLNDKANYIKCFHKVLEAEPNKANYMALGNAYMKVNRFDEAVESFQGALKCDPMDQAVALNLARSLMVIHQYERALVAFLHAIEVGNHDLRSQLEFCRALVKLRKYDEARQGAAAALITIPTDVTDWEVQAASADFHELLSSIEGKCGDPQLCVATLNQAILLYDKLTAAGRSDIPADSLVEIKAKAASLYQRRADLASQADDREGAITALTSALNLNPGAPTILLALARLFLEKGNPDKCRECCQQCLRVDEKCEEAALMLAEVSSADSVDDLADAFTKSPTFYRTLVRLIEKCARVGELSRVPSFFEHAVEGAGLYFCQGLYNVYIGEPQKAIVLFQKCKSDPDWKLPALQIIFDVYSNPFRKYVWCETKPLAPPKNLEAARKILNKLDQSAVDTRPWDALLLLSKNTVDTVTEALQIYTQSDDADLSSVIGRCKCYLRLDRQRDATRNLNGIIHSTPTHANFTLFVEAFLMMTFICLKDQQIDEAERYADKALELNKSSGKAWEMKGMIAEKKKEYMAAADSFRRAWDLSGHADLGIGFKLAVNYMRGQDPVEAIKVSRAILELHPNYPKLKETVFLPCCAALRP